LQQKPAVERLICEWIEPEQSVKRICGRHFGSLHDIVTHISVDHVGGPEVASHKCYWKVGGDLFLDYFIYFFGDVLGDLLNNCLLCYN
jgi:hypothetical protein